MPCAQATQNADIATALAVKPFFMMKSLMAKAFKKANC
jgi:hypothetical protein